MTWRPLLRIGTAALGLAGALGLFAGLPAAAQEQKTSGQELLDREPPELVQRLFEKKMLLLEEVKKDDGGTLRITTNDYGSAVSISVTSSLNDTHNGQQTGFDTTPATDDGVDVAGLIGGVAAPGFGQLLTGQPAPECSRDGVTGGAHQDEDGRHQDEHGGEDQQEADQQITGQASPATK